MKIEVKKISDKAVMPKKYSEHAAGYDICACLDKSIILEPTSVILVPTGLSIAIEAGYEVQVRPRSGLALNHQIGVLNSPGTIDPDYRGEVKVILFNFGKEPFAITHGMRIAQMVISKFESPLWEVVDDLNSTTRGEGGFGHTSV
ncbi:dUTP diphosphatase [bacterium]|nr:dUTP diphosphatase [bacterium]